jgi:hypothetical protein
MMTRQARPSAKIIGFDTHMILEAVPARHSKHQNGHQVINRDITSLSLFHPDLGVARHIS